MGGGGEFIGLYLIDDDEQCRVCELEECIAELDKRLIEYAGIATREARRVAELEAREVVLPSPQPECYGFMGEQYNIAREACAEAILAAGIKVKGE